APGVIQIPNNRCGFRRDLVENRERVGLIGAIAVKTRANKILIKRSLADARNKPFPNAGVCPARKRLALLVPIIETSGNKNSFCIGCPDRKISSLGAADSGS